MVMRTLLYRNQEGALEYNDPDRSATFRTFTCQHCNKVTYVPPLADPADIGGLCKRCMGLICPQCLAAGDCDPIEAKIERMEEAQRFWRNL